MFVNKQLIMPKIHFNNTENAFIQTVSFYLDLMLYEMFNNIQEVSQKEKANAINMHHEV